MLYILSFFAFITLLFGLALWRPSVLMAGLFSLFALKQWLIVSSPFFFNNRTLVNLIYGGAIALVALIKFPICIKSLKNQTPISLLVIALFLYAFITLLWTPAVAEGGEKWLVNWPYILVNIIVIPLLLRECRWEEFAKFQIILGIVLSLLLLFTVRWGGRGLYLSNGLFGDETNPLEIAQLGAVTAICAVFCPFRKGMDILLLRLAILTLAVVLVLKSGSRGQLFSMMFSILLVWMMVNGVASFRKSASLMLIASVLIFAIQWGLEEFWQKDQRFQTDKMTGDVEGRLDMASKLISAWSDSPISILMGLGNSAAFDPSIIGFYPHFLPLEILGEEGIIGFSLYIAILWLIFSGVIKTTKAIRKKLYPPQFVSAFSLATCIWGYVFLLTLKQGSLIGNNIFFGVTIIFAATLKSSGARIKQKAVRQTQLTTLAANPLPPKKSNISQSPKS